MLPALSGGTGARVAPSTPSQCRTTWKAAATSLLFPLNDEPVTVTVSPALPAELDRFRVARLVQANAAAPAMTVAVAAAPKTTATFFLKFIPTSFFLGNGAGTCTPRRAQLHLAWSVGSNRWKCTTEVAQLHVVW